MFGFFFYLLICVTATVVALRYGLHGDEIAEKYLAESDDPAVPWWAKPSGPFRASDNPELTYFIGSIVAGIIAIVTFGLAIASLVDVIN